MTRMIKGEASQQDSIAAQAEYAAVALARFAYGLYKGTVPVPDRVVHVTKQVLVDQLGIQVGCAALPWSASVYRYAGGLEAPGRSTVLAYGLRTNPETAAFVNAAFGHGQDFDDTCTAVQTHAGAVIVPVALAMAEHVSADGSALLRAITAGLEVMLRAAHSVSPDCLKRGHHTPPAAGPFGAAVAAGLLLGLEEEQLVHAMAIAGSFSGGLIEYTQGGGSVKRIHTAIPTTAGIRAAFLAREGITGPASVLDGVKGFCRVFSDNPRPERLTANLGTDFLIEAIGFKAYNCCYFIHAPMEAFLAITQEFDLSIDDIERVEVGTSAHGTVHVGSIPHPTDSLGAQFSTHFTLGLALQYELPGLESYTDEQLVDPVLHAFADRVHVYEDATASDEYPDNWGALVKVTTTAGETHSVRVRHQRGTPRNPLSDAELWDKFEHNVRHVLSSQQRQQLRAQLTSLGDLADAADLTANAVHPLTIRP